MALAREPRRDGPLFCAPSGGGRLIAKPPQFVTPPRARAPAPLAFASTAPDAINATRVATVPIGWAAIFALSPSARDEGGANAFVNPSLADSLRRKPA